MRRKACSLCQARENMKPGSSAGKYETWVKRGKTCNAVCQARENIQRVSSAGKRATCPKHREMFNCAKQQQARLGSVLRLLSSVKNSAFVLIGYGYCNQSDSRKLFLIEVKNHKNKNNVQPMPCNGFSIENYPSLSESLFLHI